jgi:hypothetical protein
MATVNPTRTSSSEICASENATSAARALHELQYQNAWSRYSLLQKELKNTISEIATESASREARRDEILDEICSVVETLIKLRATSLQQLTIKCAILVDFLEPGGCDLAAGLANSLSVDVETLGDLTAGWQK